MANPGWKQFERRIAAMFGGKRRGADYGGRTGGKNDIIAQGWSIEVKLWQKPRIDAILSDVEKAEARRENATDIPLAIMKRTGDNDDNALICFRLKTFKEEILPRLKEERLLELLGYD